MNIHSHRNGLLKLYESYYKRDVSSKHSHPIRYTIWCTKVSLIDFDNWSQCFILNIHSHRNGLLKVYESYYKRDVSSKHSHPIRYTIWCTKVSLIDFDNWSQCFILNIHSHRNGLLKECESYYKRDVSSKHSHPVRYRRLIKCL